MKQLLVGMAAALMSSLSLAGPSIGFDEGGQVQTGTMSWGGAGTPLIGTDIVFSTIIGDGTPLNSGAVLDCIGCLLNFETGAVDTVNPGILQFQTGGFFTIRGNAFDGAILVADDILVSGVFSGTPTVVGEDDTRLFVSQGIDSKADGLELFFGIDTEQAWKFANTELALASCVSAVGFDCDVLNADFNNTATSVPTPSSAALMPMGLLALYGFRRKLQS